MVTHLIFWYGTCYMLGLATVDAEVEYSNFHPDPCIACCRKVSGPCSPSHMPNPIRLKSRTPLRVPKTRDFIPIHHGFHHGLWFEGQHVSGPCRNQSTMGGDGLCAPARPCDASADHRRKQVAPCCTMISKSPCRCTMPCFAASCGLQAFLIFHRIFSCRSIIYSSRGWDLFGIYVS